MKTRVQHLTRMNVWAAKEVGLGPCGATTVDFAGGPAEALRVLRTKLGDASNGRSVTPSLHAIRRKLELAASVVAPVAELAAGSTQVTPHVRVTKEASDGVVVVEI